MGENVTPATNVARLLAEQRAQLAATTPTETPDHHRMSPRTLLGDFRSATATLRIIAAQHPELRDQLLPIADLLNLQADVIALVLIDMEAE